MTNFFCMIVMHSSVSASSPDWTAVMVMKPKHSQIKGTKPSSHCVFVAGRDRSAKKPHSENEFASVAPPPSLSFCLFIFIRFIMGHKGEAAKQLVIFS